jgi:transposase-like protein
MRKLIEGIHCPRCRSDAIYRYGCTANGKKRFLCQVCRRQFTLRGPGQLAPEERPSCPACGKPMHVYQRRGAWLRFRCADYPRCRTYHKKTPA